MDIDMTSLINLSDHNRNLLFITHSAKLDVNFPLEETKQQQEFDTPEIYYNFFNYLQTLKQNVSQYIHPKYLIKNKKKQKRLANKNLY